MHAYQIGLAILASGCMSSGRPVRSSPRRFVFVTAHVTGATTTSIACPPACLPPDQSHTHVWLGATRAAYIAAGGSGLYRSWSRARPSRRADEVRCACISNSRRRMRSRESAHRHHRLGRDGVCLLFCYFATGVVGRPPHAAIGSSFPCSCLSLVRALACF